MLIIYAHPKKSGHSGKILTECRRYLDSSSVKYEILDLYGMNYDPVMHPEEHYTSGGKKVSKVNQDIQNLFIKHRRFIFIYPTWWNSPPAILKGFLDKVFTAGFAYNFKFRVPIKLLKGRAIVFTSTGGPYLYSIFVNRSLKIVAKDTLAFCGIRSKTYLVGNANKYTSKQRRKIEEMVPKALKYLLK